MGKRKVMGRRRAGHHTTLVIPNETDQNRSSLMVGKRRDLWTKEVGAKTKPPMKEVWPRMSQVISHAPPMHQ